MIEPWVQFDRYHYKDFHWVQCDEPTTLALGNFRCFSLISTKFVVIIAIASGYRLHIKMQNHIQVTCT